MHGPPCETILADVAAADEPGTLRFDVYDVPYEPDAVYLHEAYASDEAFTAHREAARSSSSSTTSSRT